MNGIYRKETEKKLGKKTRVTQFHGYGAKDKELPSSDHHDVTRAIGHGAFHAFHKPKSAELVDDLDIL